MEVKMVFKHPYGFIGDLVEVNIAGSPRQVNDLVEAIRERIKSDKEAKKEHPYEHVWNDWEEI